MAVDLNDKSLRRITIRDFQGVNEYSPAADLLPNELLDVRNIDLRQTRSLRSRLGQRSLINKPYRSLFNPVKKMLRYRSSVGLRKLLVHSGDELFGDTNDDHNYDPIVSFTGTPTYHQFQDAVLYSSDLYELSSYVPGATPEIQRPRMSGVIGYNGGDDIFLTAVSATGGNLLNGYYEYRYSFEVSHGGVLLGETGQLAKDIVSGSPHDFYFLQADLSAGTNIGSVQFKKFFYSPPSYVSAFYIYRSPLRGVNASNFRAESDLDTYRIHRISIEEYNAAGPGDVLFTDPGARLNLQARKSPLEFLPRTPLMTMHKSRLWCASPSISYDIAALGPSTFKYYPDAIAFSAFEANGMEPFVFFPESLIRVGAGQPDRFQGLHSFRNQALLAWKPNSMWAVLGGDDELDFGIPNISVQLIDPNVGCVAPDSIRAIDGGVAWMSNRGPYAYYGTAPQPLQAHKIKNTMDRIPEKRRPYVVSGYDSNEREFQLFYSQPGDDEGDSQYNRFRSRFNAYSGKWTHDKLVRGVGATVEVRDPDLKSFVAWGNDDVPAAFALPDSFAVAGPLIVQGDTGFQEPMKVVPGQSQHKVKFLFQTGFLDDGSPYEDKQFQAFIIETNSKIALTVHVVIDNKYDSRASSQPIIVPAPSSLGALVWGVGKWGVAKWGLSNSAGSTYRAITRSMDTVPAGKAVSLIVSGENSGDPVEVSSLTVFYKSLGVRQTQ